MELSAFYQWKDIQLMTKQGRIGYGECLRFKLSKVGLIMWAYNSVHQTAHGIYMIVSIHAVKALAVKSCIQCYRLSGLLPRPVICDIHPRLRKFYQIGPRPSINQILSSSSNTKSREKKDEAKTQT